MATHAQPSSSSATGNNNCLFDSLPDLLQASVQALKEEHTNEATIFGELNHAIAAVVKDVTAVVKDVATVAKNIAAALKRHEDNAQKFQAVDEAIATIAKEKLKDDEARQKTTKELADAKAEIDRLKGKNRALQQSERHQTQHTKAPEEPKEAVKEKPSSNENSYNTTRADPPRASSSNRQLFAAKLPFPFASSSSSMGLGGPRTSTPIDQAKTTDNNQVINHPNEDENTENSHQPTEDSKDKENTPAIVEVQQANPEPNEANDNNNSTTMPGHINVPTSSQNGADGARASDRIQTAAFRKSMPPAPSTADPDHAGKGVANRLRKRQRTVFSPSLSPSPSLERQDSESSFDVRRGPTPATRGRKKKAASKASAAKAKGRAKPKAQKISINDSGVELNVSTSTAQGGSDAGEQGNNNGGGGGRKRSRASTPHPRASKSPCQTGVSRRRAPKQATPNQGIRADRVIEQEKATSSVNVNGRTLRSNAAGREKHQASSGKGRQLRY